MWCYRLEAAGIPAHRRTQSNVSQQSSVYSHHTNSSYQSNSSGYSGQNYGMNPYVQVCHQVHTLTHVDVGTITIRPLVGLAGTLTILIHHGAPLKMKSPSTFWVISPFENHSLILSPLTLCFPDPMASVQSAAMVISWHLSRILQWFPDIFMIMSFHSLVLLPMYVPCSCMLYMLSLSPWSWCYYNPLYGLCHILSVHCL